MTVHAVYGKLYTGSITGAAGTSGTEITNVKFPLTFEVKGRTQSYRSGRAADKIKTFLTGQTATLKISLRDLGSGAAALLFSGLASGAGATPSGTSAVKAMAAATTHPIIIRGGSSDNVLYIPAATLADDSPETPVHNDRDVSVHDGAEIWLKPTKPGTGSEPAWTWGSIADVNGSYSALT